MSEKTEREKWLHAVHEMFYGTIYIPEDTALRILTSDEFKANRADNGHILDCLTRCIGLPEHYETRGPLFYLIDDATKACFWFLHVMCNAEPYLDVEWERKEDGIRQYWTTVTTHTSHSNSVSPEAHKLIMSATQRETDRQANAHASLRESLHEQ